jgi:hypothetical protein
MGGLRSARAALVVAAGIGVVSCGGGGMGNTGTGTGAGGAGGGGTGRGGTGTVGTGGTAAGGTTGAGGDVVTGCGTVQPCGGSPVEGYWSITDECFDIGEFSLILQQEVGCAQVRVTAVEVTNRYSAFTFSSENTYSLLQNLRAEILFNFPMSCIGGVSCRDWATIQSLTAGAYYNCDGTTSCTCQEVIDDSSSDNGTYSVSGTDIVINSAVTGQSAALGYCIQGGGSTIHFITVDPNMRTGPGGGPTIFRDIVATRR